MKLNTATAGRAAEANDVIRAEITEWFTFYNGYDPMFTWWMGLPLQGGRRRRWRTIRRSCATRSRDASVAGGAGHVIAPVAAVARWKFADSVPDPDRDPRACLQDEMRDIVTRFNADGGRGVASVAAAAGTPGRRSRRCRPRATTRRGSPR